MKIQLFLFVFLTYAVVEAQSYEYLVETTSLDSFFVIEGSEERLIPSKRVDNTQFTFTSSGPKKTFIRMHCVSCDVALTAKLYGNQEDTYTKWIPLHHGEEISVERCFSAYAEKSELRKLLNDPKAALLSFWESISRGRTTRKRTPALKSSSPKSDEVKLEFHKTDYHYFLERKAFSIEFQHAKDYSVKSIYIVSQDAELIFHAGDPQILGGLFDLNQKVIPDIGSILRTEGSDSKGVYQKLNWESIQAFLFDEPKPETWYQLGIELEGDTSKHNPYLFNFRIYSAGQMEALERFFSRG